jgi:hypothetical protein
MFILIILISSSLARIFKQDFQGHDMPISKYIQSQGERKIKTIQEFHNTTIYESIIVEGTNKPTALSTLGLYEVPKITITDSKKKQFDFCLKAKTDNCQLFDYIQLKRCQNESIICEYKVDQLKYLTTVTRESYFIGVSKVIQFGEYNIYLEDKELVITQFRNNRLVNFQTLEYYGINTNTDNLKDLFLFKEIRVADNKIMRNGYLYSYEPTIPWAYRHYIYQLIEDEKQVLQIKEFKNFMLGRLEDFESVSAFAVDPSGKNFLIFNSQGIYYISATDPKYPDSYNYELLDKLNYDGSIVILKILDSFIYSNRGIFIGYLICENIGLVVIDLRKKEVLRVLHHPYLTHIDTVSDLTSDNLYLGLFSKNTDKVYEKFIEIIVDPLNTQHIWVNRVLTSKMKDYKYTTDYSTGYTYFFFEKLYMLKRNIPHTINLPMYTFNIDITRIDSINALTNIYKHSSLFINGDNNYIIGDIYIKEKPFYECQFTEKGEYYVNITTVDRYSDDTVYEKTTSSVVKATGEIIVWLLVLIIIAVVLVIGFLGYFCWRKRKMFVRVDDTSYIDYAT